MAKELNKRAAFMVVAALLVWSVGAVSATAFEPSAPPYPPQEQGQQFNKGFMQNKPEPPSVSEQMDILLTDSQKKKESKYLQSASKIAINFKDVSVIEAITNLSKQANINIVLDKDVDTKLLVTSVYSGTSIEDALKSITDGMDLAYKKSAGNFVVTPWKDSYIDVNKVYEYMGRSGSGSPMPTSTMGGIGGTASTGGMIPTPTSGQASGGLNSSSPVSISDTGGYMSSVMSLLKPMLSPRGQMTYLSSGFIWVKDSPSRVKAIEDMLATDNDKREEVNLKITIIRIDYNNENESGISWNKIFEGFKSGSPIQYNIGTNFMGTLADKSKNVFQFDYKNLGLNVDVMVKALSTYGNVKVVHSWETRALTGSVLPFKLTQTTWYSLGSTVQVINNQTITTPQISNTEVGLTVLLNPIKLDERYLVNTSVKMSSIVSTQHIGDLDLPVIENNDVAIPIKMEPGEQIVVSGFKIKSTNKETTGVPFISRLPILEYLFGYNSAKDRTSEMAVIINIDKSTRHLEANSDL